CFGPRRALESANASGQTLRYSERATTQHTSSQPLHQVLCVVEHGFLVCLELPVEFVVSSSTSSLTRDRPAPRMANYITLIRTLLSFAVVAMLHVRTKWMYVAAFILTIVL